MKEIIWLGRGGQGAFTAAKLLDTDPSECLVFEDIIKGIQAGKNAGMLVCGVEDKYSAWSRSEKVLLSDHYIESFKEVSFE